ncbi:MAG: nitrilase-related carbon-nitrogen hydrolase, partial [Stackebrandtia sp.]
MDSVPNLKTWTILAAGAASAVLFYVGTGLTPVPGLALLAPLPVLLAAPRVSAPVAVGLAFAANLAGASNNWSWYAVSHDIPLWPMGVLITVSFSATFALSAWAYRSLMTRGRPLAAAVTAPALWTGVVYLVSVLNPMGMSFSLASTLADLPVIVQTAAVTGMWGVEFLVLFTPSAIAAILTASAPGAARMRIAAVAAVVVALVVGGGAWRLASDDGTSPTHKVALLSHNESDWGADVSAPEGKKLLDSYLDRISELPEDVDTVVLPEGEFAADAASRPNLVDPLRQLAGDRNITIVVGYQYHGEDGRFNNAIAVPGDGGEPVDYTKHHDTGNVPGTELAFAPGSDDKAGMMICGDLNFPDPSRDYGLAGARLMLIPAADENVNGRIHARDAVYHSVEH